jgi:hypothetical protein
MGLLQKYCWLGYTEMPITGYIQKLYFLLSSYEIWESIGFTSEKSKKKFFANFNVLDHFRP